MRTRLKHWRQQRQEASSPTWEYSSSGDFDYPSTIIPEENQEDAPTDPEHINVTIAVNDNEFDQEIAGYDACRECV